MISFVIVTWNCLRQIKECLRTLSALNLFDIEIIIVDGNSHDGTVEYLKEFPRIRFFPLPFKDSWSQNNILGISQARGDWICVMNPDIYFNESFRYVLDVLRHSQPPYPIVVPQLVYPDGKLQNGFPIIRFRDLVTSFMPSGRVVEKYLSWMLSLRGESFIHGSGHEVVTVKHPRGSFFIVHRETLNLLGGYLWNPRLRFACADSDMFRRADQIGVKVLMVPSSRIVHEEGHSIRARPRPETERELSYGFVTYARLWNEHPRILSGAYFLDCILSFVIPPVRSKITRYHPSEDSERRPYPGMSLRQFLQGYGKRMAAKLSGVMEAWSA